MASFVIHTIVGETLLNRIEEIYNISISDYDKKEFLLGNLIVDSLKTSKEIPHTIPLEKKTEYKMEIKNKIRKEKLTTHFRELSKEGECIKTPNPDMFLNKYQELLKENYSVLGYLFHLYTDKLFFSKLFIETFDTIDSAGNLVKYDKDLESIRIKKNGIIVDAKEFWSGTSHINIYNDYTIINKLLLERFGTSFDKDVFIKYAQEYFINPGIEEVDFSKASKIIVETQNFIEESYNNQNDKLSVFKEEDIIDFVSYVVEQFIHEYNELLDNLYNQKKKRK